MEGESVERDTHANKRGRMSLSEVGCEAELALRQGSRVCGKVFFFKQRTAYAL